MVYFACMIMIKYDFSPFREKETADYYERFSLLFNQLTYVRYFLWRVKVGGTDSQRPDRRSRLQGRSDAGDMSPPKRTVWHSTPLLTHIPARS